MASTKRTEAAPPPQEARVPPTRIRSADVPAGSESMPAQMFIGALIMGISNRMMTDASSHHRQRWNLGLSEWRALVALGGADALIVRELAIRADLDYALASKSLKVLADRGLVTLEQTQTRGRATVVRLTAEGKAIRKEMIKASVQRQKRLMAAFTEQEAQTLRDLLVKLERQVPGMQG